MIHLGNWEFVKFIKHDSHEEKSIFKSEFAINNNILFLVQYKGKIKIMGYRADPWL